MWVDGFAAEGVRRIQIYDRGHRHALDVFGETAPVERARLGPRGRGLLVRAGAQGGAWFDLDDGRRLPLALPSSIPGSTAPVSFTARGDALWWRDDGDASLSLVPLAPGLPLQRRDDGSVIPIAEPGGVAWVVSSLDAPVLLVKGIDGSASFLRYADAADPIDGIVRAGTTSALSLPSVVGEHRSCGSATGCSTFVSLDPSGELAMLVDAGADAQWSIFDRRAPQLAGPLALPEALSAAAASGGLGLLHVIDRSVSVWLGAGQLFWWERGHGLVDSVPLFATPPLFWSPVARGRALVLLSMTGPMYRVDAAGLRVVNLETTDCPVVPGSEPVLSPLGDWAAWSCRDSALEPDADTGVIARVSVDGLERYVGVPMVPLAIDDEGALLLFSVESVLTDEIDGVSPTGRPRSLFVLSSDNTLTRIDELEPAPAPALLGVGDIATYMQGAALD